MFLLLRSKVFVPHFANGLFPAGRSAGCKNDDLLAFKPVEIARYELHSPDAGRVQASAEDYGVVSREVVRGDAGGVEDVGRQLLGYPFRIFLCITGA